RVSGARVPTRVAVNRTREPRRRTTTPGPSVGWHTSGQARRVASGMLSCCEERHDDPDPVPPRVAGHGRPARPAHPAPARGGGGGQRAGRRLDRSIRAAPKEPCPAPRGPTLADPVPQGVSASGAGPLRRAHGAADPRNGPACRPPEPGACPNRRAREARTGGRGTGRG